MHGDAPNGWASGEHTGASCVTLGEVVGASWPRTGRRTSWRYVAGPEGGLAEDR
jgi:hypothetical protein